MPFFEGTALLEELVGSFHHAYFKAGMISFISKNLKKYYSVVLLFMKLVCPQPPYFGYRKNYATLDFYLIHIELKKIHSYILSFVILLDIHYWSIWWSNIAKTRVVIKCSNHIYF